MKELATKGNINEELSKLLNENYEERIMMVGEAFSIRDQMVCNQQDLKEIDEYINVYSTEKSLKIFFFYFYFFYEDFLSLRPFQAHFWPWLNIQRLLSFKCP